MADTSSVVTGQMMPAGSLPRWGEMSLMWSSRLDWPVEKRSGATIFDRASIWGRVKDSISFLLELISYGGCKNSRVGPQ
jgi:hypothetical protein